MARSVFITGTDTGVGKTLISTALIRALRTHGLRVAGMKPVASGSEMHEQGLRNADALCLQTAASVQLPYATVNPYTFAPAIAPHIAAQLAGTPIELERIVAAYRQCMAAADAVVVEGAGGWRLPLGETRGEGSFLSDFVKRESLDVLLVVGLRLGCLNHARLTAEAIQGDGCKLIGWIGNRIDPNLPFAEENITTLQALLEAPCLGIVPHFDEIPLESNLPLDWTPILARS